jgi:hypothetical protein
MVKQAFGNRRKEKENGAEKGKGKGKGKKVKGKGGHGGCETLQLHDDGGGEVCSLVLPPAAPALAGPRINLFLPSFSGRTPAGTHRKSSPRHQTHFEPPFLELNCIL